MPGHRAFGQAPTFYAPLELALRQAAEGVKPDEQALRSLYGKHAAIVTNQVFLHSQNEDLGQPEDLTNAILLASGAGDIAAGLSAAGRFAAGRVAGDTGVRAAEDAVAGAAAKAGEEATKTGLKDALRSVPAKAAAKAVSKADAVRALPDAVRAELEKAATKAGSRAAAKRAAEGTASKLYAHPLVTGSGVVAAAHRAGAPGGSTLDALWTGHLAALANNPLGTGLTTARALAGSVAAPAALLYSAGQSAVEADPRALENTASSQAQGLGEIAGNLLSGDPKRVQNAVEHEAGLSFLTPIPALTKLGKYEDLRSSVRDAAKSARASLAGRTGLPLRHGPDEQNVFGFAERWATRKGVAKQVQRETAPERLKASKHAHAIEKAARKVKGARSLRNIHGIEGGDVAQTLLEYGINDPKQIALLREKGPVGDVPRKGDVTLRAVLDHLEQMPDLIHDKHLKVLLERYRQSEGELPLSKVGKGRRAAAAPQGELFGVRPPEERVPIKARKYTTAADRAGAWRDLKEKQKAAKELRTEARKVLAQSEVKGGAEAAALKARARDLYHQARKVEADVKSFKKAMDPFTRPGQAVSSRARRKLYDAHLLDEYVAEVGQKAAEHGLDPGVFTHHAPIRQEGEIGQGARALNAATRVQHVRTLDAHSLAARDVVDRSLRGLLTGSVVGPRLKEAGRSLTRSFVAKESVPLKVGEVSKRRVTQAEFSQAIRDGQLSEAHYVWVPESFYKQSFVDPAVSAEQIHAGAMEALKGELPVQTKGAKGVIVRKEAFKEFTAQLNPAENFYGKLFNATSSGLSRALLFSPAWVIAQAIAEGLPMIVAHPRLILDPTYAARLGSRLGKFNDISKEEAVGFAAVMGEAPVRVETARDLRPQFTPTAHMFSDGARAIERNPIGRALFSTARLRPFALFDQYRQGKYRQILAAAEADKRFNGFLSGLQSALRSEKTLADELRKLPPEEQLQALTQPRYQSELNKVVDGVEAVLGNWTSFTRLEQKFAPALIFYPFLRYAFRFPLVFAKAHPIAATISYFLAQQNANQLEKVLGTSPAQFSQFAEPVVTGPDGEKQVLPGGTRVTPGLNSPIEGVLNLNAREGAIGALNLPLAAGVGLVTGENSFGEHDEHEGLLGLHWSLAAQQLVSVPPVLRYLGVGQSNSPTAQELRELDPNRKLRSFALPFLPESGEAARKSNEIIKSLDGSSGGSSGSSPGEGWAAGSPEATGQKFAENWALGTSEAGQAQKFAESWATR